MSTAPDIDQVIPSFELLAKVGEGGYGEVYLAKSVTGQYRAVKIIYRDRVGSAEAFEREFRGAKFYETVSRKHPNLVDILLVGRDNERGFFYYVMDAADDERGGRTFDPSTYRPRTLRSELSMRTALPIEECISIGLNLASALVFLQEHGLVHRDVKPSNIVFIDGQLKLADIGLVTDVREAKSIVGTPGYAPPEHHGAYSGDVYSLGKLLYEISTGRDSRNFGEAPSDEADTDDPRFAEFNSIVCKACAKHYKDRYQTAKALLKALTELGSKAEGDATVRPTRVPWLSRRPLRRENLAALVCLALTPVCQVVRIKGWPHQFGAVYDAATAVQVLCYIAFAVLTVIVAFRSIRTTLRPVAILIAAVCVAAYVNTKISDFMIERAVAQQQQNVQGEQKWEFQKFPDAVIACPPGGSVQAESEGRYTIRHPVYPGMAVGVHVNGLASFGGQTDAVCKWLVDQCVSRGLTPVGSGFSSAPYRVDATLTTEWFRCDSMSSNGVLRCDIFVPVGDTLVFGWYAHHSSGADPSGILSSWVAATCSGLRSR